MGELDLRFWILQVTYSSQIIAIIYEIRGRQWEGTLEQESAVIGSNWNDAILYAIFEELCITEYFTKEQKTSLCYMPTVLLPH